ncbi:MAG: squalene/phytoene synthase family protein [Galbitalea sp.]
MHAFGLTARELGIDRGLTEPFFASMRSDLSATEHDEASFGRYVYGSAEVVGLMCLRAFLEGQTPDRAAARRARGWGPGAGCGISEDQFPARSRGRLS